ncbi:hypothetical protein F442_09583 [Phytophthora nicotianae P10297]|uniref:Uncharacterized protein n=1 Tax=Phytophthora nicotianae P10297 TaxID=1317064 RepID=W2Z907_PHYNI|nr:hypothetical protein F442_09583 [Phytophthora nicotianae P10297]
MSNNFWGRSGWQSVTGCPDTRGALTVAILDGKSDRRDSDRRRDDYCNQPRVTLVEASLDGLLAELEGRDDTQGSVDRSGDEGDSYVDDTEDYGAYQSDGARSNTSGIGNDLHLAAANENERRAAAEETYTRSDNRQPRGNVPDHERGFNQDRRGGDRGFNQDYCGRRDYNNRDFNRDNRRPPYGPCAACRGMSHSAHYCNKRCKFCKQVHDVGQCELFRNF